MRVHILEKLEPEWLKILNSNLDNNVLITHGEEIPIPAEFDILVAGVPQQKHIEASPNLATLIIPWAGLPKSTRELMLKYPQIAVHNMHHNARPVAESAVALMFAAAKNIIPIDRALRQNDWSPRYDINYNTRMITGKRVLILGYGAIGREIAIICRGFGIDITAIKRNVDRKSDNDIKIKSLDTLPELLPKTDILFVALPHTPVTNGLLGKKELALLPENAIIVNIARGRIIDEEALYNELDSGRLRAGLDVWYEYPQTEENRTNQRPSRFDFGKLDNVVMTPHMAEHTTETEIIRFKVLAEMLNQAAGDTSLPNKVDLERGY